MSWPIQEAEKILARIKHQTPSKGYVLFETGYGPSGLPHIGTFGEVARTQMVRHAFHTLAPNIPTKLFCVSDDMDGFRKVPENVPNHDMLHAHLGKALTNIPDPFDTHPSYGAHMNHRLQQFLDHFGFEYEFKSATELYQSGFYDEKLLLLLERYEQVLNVMLPTLGADRKKTYSPFMPISPKSGKVLQVPILEYRTKEGSIVFEDEDGSKQEVPVTGGHCKLQWKPDFGMRWAALDVDFEMYGKDHLVSAKLYSAICSIAGGTPPEQFMFELFLDEKGEKISKSKGNGLSLEEWLRYGPAESLQYYMYQQPRKAKKLYFGVIPKAFDEYLNFLRQYPEQEAETHTSNPVWHIHKGTPPEAESPLSFSLILNLASACGAEDADVLWGFISRYAKGATPENAPHLDAMVKHAIHYYEDHIKPHKTYRNPSKEEKCALEALITTLENAPSPITAEDAQQCLFDIGKAHGFEPMRNWFTALYQILLGQDQGPRFGSFIALFGKEETIQLIKERM